ncbi:BQ2448_1435 [Microbotryum intermedium]|uniref:BQ2448_1435 protein n=1 Tax=Microbotryum intermedium TaxID=269621 RepID=A0A238FD54_9BASI|nr:BQ2448_1435 [Microbotryum intermedium]
MNSEAAQQALDIARRHYNSDNLDSALRFVKKSITLHPTSEAKTLLEQVQVAQASGAGGGTRGTSSATSQGTTQPTSRKPTASTSTSTSSGASTTKAEAREFTPAQLALVKKVKACKVTEYYAILGLDKTCSDSEIKKAYRKLALGLHPDKCGAPGTEEAFKMVSKAFQVLSDGNKRAIFDQTGSDPDSRGGGGGGGGGGGMHPFARGGGGGAEEMSPEDLFRFFFSGAGGGGGSPFGSQFGGGGFQFYGPGGIRMQTGGGMPRRAGGQGGGGQREQGSIWIQIAPLLLLFAFSLLSQLPSLFGSSTPADPEFTFEPTTRYSIERTTNNMHINYYVNPVQFASHPIYDTFLSNNPSLGFKSSHEAGTTAYKADLTRFLSSEKEGSKTTEQVQRLRIPKSLATFERTVEQTYVARLQHTCRQELQYRDERLDRARGFLGFGADWDKVREITNEKLPRCEELSKLGYRVDYR